MEITIRTICPKCDKEIEIYSRTSSEATRKEHEEAEEMFFGCVKGATEKAANIESSSFFEDVFEHMPAGRNAINYVKNYFDALETKIRISDDLKKLLRLSNELAKTKVKVSKPVLNEVNEGKKRVLKALKRRVKEIKMQNRERLKMRAMRRKCEKKIKLHEAGCEKFDRKGRKILFDFCKKGQKRGGK